MDILLDTNILLRLSQPNHPHEPVARKAVSTLQQKHRCVICPQVIYEYWVVATRPVDVNGFGFDTESASLERDRYLDLFNLLRDERSIFERWTSLVDEYKIQGVNSHDARLVAAMQRHSISHILTFNVRDFLRYSIISVLSPDDVVASSDTLESEVDK